MTDVQDVEETEEVVEEVLVDEDAALQYLLSYGTERLVSQISNEVVNPIELAKALNIRPQMVYNHIRSGRIPSHHNDSQKLVIDLRDALEYSAKYLNRKAVKQAKIDAELAGE